MKNQIKILMLLYLIAGTGCKKEGFLDAKTDQSLSVPATLQDYRLLLNNENLFNANAPVLGSITANDYYITTTTWENVYTNTEKNAYIWAKDLFEGQNDFSSDWDTPYQQVYVANTVLDGLARLGTGQNQASYEEIRGTALFFRSVAFYNLLETFSLPYDKASASQIAGIPLRLSSDLNQPSVRSSQRVCYDQVTADLASASLLLPKQTALPTRPSKAAALGMLARICLAMGDFAQALKYADATLRENDALTDFNTFVPQAYTLTKGFIPDDLFHTSMTNSDPTSIFGAIIDADLYQQYKDDDLRKSYYFFDNGGIRDRSTYDFARASKYCGIATDEMILIRAECYARQGNIPKAMEDLNALLVKRYKTGTFIPLTAAGAENALRMILTERRKELVFRGLRWTDLRRLNKDPRFRETLSRTINGTIYTLPPNDKRYAMEIPPREIELSGIPQNNR